MSLLLAIHSFPGANAALQRHWPYFERAGADDIWVIGTDNAGTWFPPEAGYREIGENKYIDAAHLPTRLVDTFAAMLQSPHSHLAIAEYDTLIFHRLRWEAMEHGAAAHLACNGQVYNCYHNPWILHREVAAKFVEEGRKVITEGLCGYGTEPSSPDCFFGLVACRMQQPVQTDLIKEFSRNSFDCEGDLDRAREAYRSGMDALHGVKKAEELEYILG